MTEVDNRGNLSEPINQILRRVRRDFGLYLFLATSQRPPLGGTGAAAALTTIHLRAMSTAEIKQLIATVANRRGIRLSSEQIAQLADYAAGYPPAVYYAIDQVQSYGLPLVLADKEKFIEFRVSSLIRYLKQFRAGEEEQAVLRLYAVNSPLPLEVAGRVLNISSSVLAATFTRLIDASLLVPSESGHYEIAEPVRDAVAKDLPSLEPLEFAKVADALGEYLSSLTNMEMPRLELERVRYRALVLAGDTARAETAFHLASDWIYLAERFYHRQEYEKAVTVARAAVTARPKNYDARRHLVRALIKLGEYEEARNEVGRLSAMGHRREAEYFLGFLERNRGDHKAAVWHYQRALGAGHGGVAIHRELAQCYFELGDIRSAQSHIQQAQSRKRDNRFVLDLQAKIAIRLHDEKTAREILELLERVENEVYYNHRRSTVEYEFGNRERAYEAAKQAVNAADRPPFAVLTQLAKCEIATDRLTEAKKTLGRLNREYSRQQPDIRIGLRCRILIADHRYRDALELWDQLHEKSRPIHAAIRRDAIQGLLGGNALSDAEREEFENEFRELNERLGETNQSMWDLLL